MENSNFLAHDPKQPGTTDTTEATGSHRGQVAMSGATGNVRGNARGNASGEATCGPRAGVTGGATDGGRGNVAMKGTAGG